MEGISLLSASEIPSDRLIFSAGARGTEKGTKGWIRSNDQSFRTANKFLAVYCDRATRLIFPSAEPRSFQLEGNSSPEDCMSVPAEELPRLALEVLNGKLAYLHVVSSIGRALPHPPCLGPLHLSRSWLYRLSIVSRSSSSSKGERSAALISSAARELRADVAFG